jgi:prepilin-type N-terminal cleavage/methylation domain-containing protein
VCIRDVAQAYPLVALGETSAFEGPPEAAVSLNRSVCNPAIDALRGAPRRQGRSSRLSASPAFTLIELLVTVVILSSGIVLVLRAFNTAVVALDRGRGALESTRQVRNLVAELQIEAAEKGRLSPGRRSGHGGSERLSGMLWETHVERLNLPSSDVTNALYKVTVTTGKESIGGWPPAATYIRSRER